MDYWNGSALHNKMPGGLIVRCFKVHLNPLIQRMNSCYFDVRWIHYTVWVKKKRDWLKFSPNRSWMAAQQLFCKNMSKLFLPSWRCLRCMMAFAGAFTTKQQFMHPHCIVNYDKTGTKTVLKCFTKMMAEQPSLTLCGQPMYHYERKINMPSSTDNNFMIFLLDFERWRIASRFPFFFFFLTHTFHYESESLQCKIRRNSLLPRILQPRRSAWSAVAGCWIREKRATLWQ